MIICVKSQAQLSPTQAQLILDWYAKLQLADSVITEQQITIDRQSYMIDAYIVMVNDLEQKVATKDSIETTYLKDKALLEEQAEINAELYKKEKPKKYWWAGVAAAAALVLKKVFE